jgi:hypothetical protein
VWRVHCIIIDKISILELIFLVHHRPLGVRVHVRIYLFIRRVHDRFYKFSKQLITTGVWRSRNSVQFSAVMSFWQCRIIELVWFIYSLSNFVLQRLLSWAIAYPNKQQLYNNITCSLFPIHNHILYTGYPYRQTLPYY